MELVKISALKTIAQKEQAQTFEFSSISPSSGRILAFRAKGSISGNHWHDGNSAAKDPEELVLIQGKKLSLKSLDSTDIDQEHIVEAPAQIHINKLVFHRLEALTDCVFIEFNSLAEHAADTKYP